MPTRPYPILVALCVCCCALVYDAAISSAQAPAARAFHDDDAGVPELVPPPPAAVIVPPSPLPAAEPSYGAKGRVEPLGPADTAPYGTGSRLDIPLEELPATVSVLDKRTLQERGALSIDQALGFMPGIQPTWQYGGFLHIRARGFQAVTLNDGYRDTRALVAESAPQAGLLDLERIEVLRGPSSVLYGYGAVGAAVNLIRNQPSRTSRYEAALAFGLPNQRVLHVGAQGPLGAWFSYRVDVGQVTHRDFRGSSSERNQASAAVRFAPDEQHSLQLRLGLSADRYSLDLGIPTVEDPERPGQWHLPAGSRWANNYGTANDEMAYRRIDINADYRYRFDRKTYLQARLNVVDDYYMYTAAEEQTYVPGMDGMPSHVDRNYLAFGRGWTPVTGRLELHSEANTGPLKHRFLAGYELNWFGGKSDRGNQGGLTPPAIDFAHPIDNSEPIPFVRTSQDHYRHVTHSVYAFDHVHVLDNLIATGGLRADFLRSRVQREFLDRETQAVTANPMTGVRPPVVKDHAEALTGQIGAVFTPIEPITTYVSYATSFMPALVYPSNQGPNDFAPERGEQVEGGVRLRISPQQHVLQVDAALYYILKRNVVIPRGQDEYSQAGKVQSHGFDISLRYSAPRFIELDASYSYTRASYRTFVDVDPVTGENQSLKGKQVGFSPRHSANAWLRVLFTKQVGIGLGVRAMADQYADAENRVAMPDFALLDASAFVRARYATFILSANNVLDTHRYYTSVINTFNVNPQVTPGLGREVLGTVRLTY